MGYDTEKEYVELAEKRIREYKQQLTIPLFVEKAESFTTVRDNQTVYSPENAEND